MIKDTCIACGSELSVCKYCGDYYCTICGEDYGCEDVEYRYDDDDSVFGFYFPSAETPLGERIDGGGYEVEP